MPVIHEPHPLPVAQAVAHPGTPSEQGWDLHRRQIASQLLRDIEVQRLPEALAIRDQVLNGESISLADRESLAQMVLSVDRISELLEDEYDLGGARESVVRLRDEILAHV